MKNLILLAIFVVFISFETGESFTVNCDYRMSFISVVGEVYTCNTADIPTSSGNIVTGVTGSHLSNKTNEDVEYIYIEGGWTLSFVPQGFSNFFPNIKAIFIQQSTFDTLFGDELNEFPKLEFLDIWGAFLTTISSRLFEKTPNMKVIVIEDTMLQRVGHNLFTPLNVSQLFRLAFAHNYCIDKAEWDGNQTAINLIIDELRQSCPYDHEGVSTTTALTTTTTEKNLICSERQIEDLVCDLKNEIEEVQENSAIKDERIEKLENDLIIVREETRNELQNANNKINELENEQTQLREDLQLKEERIEEFESRIKWLEEEILRITENPCACK